MIYVLSDIHGNARRFDAMLAQIDLRPEDTLYILGDAIDRHPEGIAILQKIMAMPNVKMLLGNHEYMLLRALGRPYDDNVDNGTALAHWYRNGGLVTHEAFNALPAQQQNAILDYLHSLPLEFDLVVNSRAYKLVHGGPVECFDHDPKYAGPSHYAVWKRWNLGEQWPRGYSMIFGHTPTRYYRDIAPMEVWHYRKHIGIDCGCGYPEDPNEELAPYGRLACLRLDDGEVFYVK